MSRANVFFGLVARILATPAIAFALGIGIPGLAAYGLLQHNAERETQEKAVMLSATLDAVQRYAEVDVAAALSKDPDASHIATASHAIRKVMEGIEKSGKTLPYRFRIVSNDPTNSINKADPYESKLVTAFSADPKLKQVQGEYVGKDGRYQVIAKPITANSGRCLSCHSSAKTAPAARVKHFPGKGGYGWKKGQVVGATVLYVPADGAYYQAAAIFRTVLRMVAVLCLCCIALMFWQANRCIARPINRMLRTSQAIRRGEWGARYHVRFPDEIGALANSFQDTTLWLREQVAKEEKLRSLFQQFIPASVAAKTLGKDSDEVMMGTSHSCSVMIINIRNFKLLMQHLPPEQTVTTLNEFFAEVNKVILEHKGIVSKYLGDTVMAFFGVMIDDPSHALNAVKAAMAMPRALQDLYVRLDEKHGWELGVGIGISTGEPIIGHFGSSEHMEFTVLGDVVVHAHQLEKITKSAPEEDTIVISEATYRLVMSDVHVFDLGEKPAGDGVMVQAYAVQGLRSEIRKSMAA